MGSGSGLGISSGARRVPAPLTLIIESLDRDEYLVSDQFSFRIRFQNVGRTDVILPWTPNAHEVATGENAPPVRCLLTFDARTDTDSETLTFLVATLYGSTLSPGTLKTIRPGDSVVIIGESSFRFQTDAVAARVRAKMPHPLRMVARLAFMSGTNGVVYQDIVSRNQMPIVLTRRGGGR
jgi:hypothetical protein